MCIAIATDLAKTQILIQQVWGKGCIFNKQLDDAESGLWTLRAARV